MVKHILRKYKYPPDLQDAAVELVLQQTQVMGESWAGLSRDFFWLESAGGAL